MAELVKTAVKPYIQVFLLVLFTVILFGREAQRKEALQANTAIRTERDVDTRQQTFQQPSQPTSQLPQVIIYRRSKKTGSSSMLEALLNATAVLGYVPIHYSGTVMSDLVHMEALKPSPRRLLIAAHNRITRDDTLGLKTVIIDTVLDGFRQITADCRFSNHAKDCGDSMIACMQQEAYQGKNWYRWAGRNGEDAATYIDLPLSSGHPGLSTTVFRNIFHGATLDVKKRNVAGSSCEANPKLRATYLKHFAPIEKQVDKLRRRMLALAGYPPIADGAPDITSAQLVDAAEKIESKKYNLGSYKSTIKMGPEHARVRHVARIMKWKKSKTGEIELVEE